MEISLLFSSDFNIPLLAQLLWSSISLCNSWTLWGGERHSTTVGFLYLIEGRWRWINELRIVLVRSLKLIEVMMMMLRWKGCLNVENHLLFSFFFVYIMMLMHFSLIIKNDLMAFVLPFNSILLNIWKFSSKIIDIVPNLLLILRIHILI